MDSSFIANASSLRGEIHVPPSKSHTLRGVLFGAMGSGRSVIRNYLPSSDTEAMIEACRHFGAEITLSPTQITIDGVAGVIQRTEDVIFAGNSGIILRFCTAIGALGKGPVVITGDHSIRHQRPMSTLIEALEQLGATAETMRGDGYAPLIVRGPLRGGKAVLLGEDSQPVSAMLIAAAFAAEPIALEVKRPGEKPWVELTLDWFRRLGIPYENESYSTYRLKGKARYDGFKYHVPGDFSSAAFPIAAALITRSKITLKNIQMEDIQGDKEVIDVFKQMGAKIEVDPEAHQIHVDGEIPLKGIEIDINNFIDAITILAVVGCYASGETRIFNGAIARTKECDRIRCITSELKKMGADISETEDGLVVRQSKLKGTTVHSHNDHRMAMSLSVAAFGASDETTILFVECVKKTFPTFIRDFQTLGANIKEYR